MRVATYNGKGEFYSGIRTGERVRVNESKFGGSVSIQSIRHPGAWLAIYGSQLLANPGILTDWKNEQDA